MTSLLININYTKRIIPSNLHSKFLSTYTHRATFRKTMENLRFFHWKKDNQKLINRKKQKKNLWLPRDYEIVLRFDGAPHSLPVSYREITSHRPEIFDFRFVECRWWKLMGDCLTRALSRRNGGVRTRVVAGGRRRRRRKSSHLYGGERKRYGG